MNPESEAEHRLLLPPAWVVDTAQMQAWRTTWHASSLPSLAVVRCEGPDAATFLQGQITVDAVGLTHARWQYAGLCDPKGRLLAMFFLWRQGEHFFLALPAALAETVVKRLRLYVLRAKVSLSIDPTLRLYGICHHETAAPAGLAGISGPIDRWQCRDEIEGMTVLGLGSDPTGMHRLLLATASYPAPEPEATEALWWLGQVQSAHPMVFPATSACFVPQGINLEVLGGVSFRKGCYTGQEVVARSQYLGKLRRRLRIGRIQGAVSAGDVYVSGQPQAVGRVLMSVTLPSGLTTLAFECPSDRLDGPPLCVGADGGPVIELLALPYELIDPTA